MTRFVVWAILAMAFFVTPALGCPSETEEARITEALTADDSYYILEGAELDTFITNANDLYNIGWQRNTVAKLYVIEAEYKDPSPHFQVYHLFFIGPDGCIVYYQSVYGAVLQLVMSHDPQKQLDNVGITREELAPAFGKKRDKP